MTRPVVLAIVLLLSWAGLAQAEKRVALVIGNSAYTAIQPLANPRTLQITEGAKGLRSHPEGGGLRRRHRD